MIIGVTGHMRNGKDSVAQIFERLYGFEHRLFARPLKDACKVIFDWNEEHVNGKLKDVIDDRWGITPRLAMQLLGTEYGQFTLTEKSPTFAEKTGRCLWVKRCLIDAGNKNIVVSDVRFIHEADSIKNLGGVIIRVIRFGYESGSGHASETEVPLIKADFIVRNDGTLGDLENEIVALADSLGMVKC
jgi:hypothetical protein